MANSPEASHPHLLPGMSPTSVITVGDNALSGFFADQDTLALIARHVRGEITMPELVDGVRQVVAKITATGSAADHRHQVEANFMTMRLYELVIDPV